MLESRLGADIYNEPTMIEEYLHGSGDIHSLTAKHCFPKELKDIEVKDIKAKFPELRKKAKPVEFSQQFGGTDYAIQNAMSCSLEEAHEIGENYRQGFKGIARFKDKGSKFVRSHGYVVMCQITGHKMYWWDWNKWRREQQSYTQEFWDEYRQYHKGTGDEIAQEVSKHFRAASKWDRMALNAPTQGSGIIILKTAMVNFFHWIIQNNLFGIIKIVDLVHDEACIEYPENHPEVAVKLKEFMEASSAFYCKKLPIPAEAEVSDHWVH